jgi:hypothetical protein
MSYVLWHIHPLPTFQAKSEGAFCAISVKGFPEASVGWNATHDFYAHTFWWNADVSGLGCQATGSYAWASTRDKTFASPLTAHTLKNQFRPFGLYCPYRFTDMQPPSKGLLLNSNQYMVFPAHWYEGVDRPNVFEQDCRAFRGMDSYYKLFAGKSELFCLCPTPTATWQVVTASKTWLIPTVYGGVGNTGAMFIWNGAAIAS